GGAGVAVGGGADEPVAGVSPPPESPPPPPPVPPLPPPPLSSPPPPLGGGSAVTAVVALSPQVSPASVTVAVTSRPTGTEAGLTSHLPVPSAVALPTKPSISFRDALWVAKTRTVAPGSAVPATLGC